MSVATFAAGCFWGVEAEFRKVEGVVQTEVGYTGGDFANPTYPEVCSGRTGHAEAVRVEFDPGTVSYEQLLELFWAMHDPTQLNRQGPDVGTQYRSAVFVNDAAQEAAAKGSRENAQLGSNRPLVTEIGPAGDWWPAEEYHQRYLAKRGQDSCASTVRN
ncbi:MAG: peptide-methionine (S)-S-oxide reductase MsrA [Planctomycetota bacterium]|jgi:peptide-methionine (S)-S-oxide reductase